MFKFLTPVALGLALTLSACGSNYNVDEVPDISPENLYNIAKANMADGEYGVARRYLEALDSRYPFGDLTEQVQLDLIHIYYKIREPELALAQIARFTRLSPTHPNIDYVYYMKGLVQIQQRSDILQDYLELDRSQKDPTNYYNAFNTFRDLIKAYPNSIYAADARQRMIYIKDQLARREMAIARYYYERGAYLSSVRHTQAIMQSYRNTSQLKPALDLMLRCYERLKLEDPANNIRSVIKNSFGEGRYKPVPMQNNTLPLAPGALQPGVDGKVKSTSKSEDSGFFDSITSFFGFGDSDDELPPPSKAPNGQVQPAVDGAPIVDDSEPAPEVVVVVPRN